MLSTRDVFFRMPVSWLALVMVFVVALTACGGAPASQPADQSPTQPTESATDVAPDQDQQGTAATDDHGTTPDTESSPSIETEMNEGTHADGHASMDMDMDMHEDESMGEMDEEHGMAQGHGGSNSAAYMLITNDSDTPDAIINADTDVAETVELHTVINENGVMKMRPVEQIDIPAQGSQHLKPGGFHVMLLGITQDLKAGDTVVLTLTLEQAGDIQISAPVSMMPLENGDQTITSGAITIQNPWVRAAVALPAAEGSMEHTTGPMDVEHEHADEHEHEGELGHEHEPLDLSAIVPIAAGETVRVVATTSIVGDIVQHIGGDAIELNVLMPVGTDPHTFEPTPQDIVAVSEADVVFVNGAGLETFLEPLLEGSDVDPGKIISVSHHVPLITFAGKPDNATMDEHEDEHEAVETTDHSDEHHHSHGDMDPHVWLDPLNIEVWANTIEQTLAHANPSDAAVYADNAQQYIEELHSLDTWIREQVALIPATNRQMVTDHTAFGYFAQQYGIEQIGAVIPGLSTLAEPTAQDLAALEDTIREHSVPALFVGTTVNPALAERIAQDTGIKIVRLYTGSLSELGGEAASYLDFMRYNTTAIVGALQDTKE